MPIPVRNLLKGKALADCRGGSGRRVAINLYGRHYQTRLGRSIAQTAPQAAQWPHQDGEETDEENGNRRKQGSEKNGACAGPDVAERRQRRRQKNDGAAPLDQSIDFHAVAKTTSDRAGFKRAGDDGDGSNPMRPSPPAENPRPSRRP